MLSLDDGAVVGGNLIYTSNQKAAIATGATVRGAIQQHTPQRMGVWPAAGPFGHTGDSVIGWLRTLIGLFVLGLLFILLAPRFGRRTVGTLGGSPWASLGLGIALLICVPIAALLVFVVGLFVGGWWLALILLALYGIALVLSVAVSGLFLGRWILERVGRRPVPLVWALLLGLGLLLLVSLVPVAGGVVIAVAMFCGLGALALTAVRSSGTPPTATDRAPALSGSTG
jgi:hypothetical protein